jgi:GNAT superfamily N-acetyltransferase
MKSSLRIRPWRASDLKRLAHLGSRVSSRSLTARFWTGMPAMPESYLRSIEARWPRDWDAVVAIRDGQLVGWAEFGRNGTTSEADAAFLVIDAEQGRGTGTALMRALVDHAARAGITTLHADISSGNAPALHAWQRAIRGLPATMTLGVDGYRGTIAVPHGAATRAA